MVMLIDPHVRHFIDGNQTVCQNNVNSVYTRTVASNKFWSSMSFLNLIRLSQIKNVSLPYYTHVNKVSKKLEKNYN
jgi:hypothetical protein